MQFRTLISYARRYSSALLWLSALTMASSLVTLAIPWFAGQILGGIVTGSVSGQRGVVTLLVAALVAVSLLSFAVANQSTVTAARLLADLRQRVFEHLQKLPIGFHENRGKGDTLALMTYESTRLSQFLTGTVVAIPSRLLTTAGAIVLMFKIDQRLAMVVPLLIPAFYLILKVVGRRLRSLAVSLQRAEAEIVALAEEMLEMLPASKAFTREAADAQRYWAKVDDASRMRIREGRIYAVLDPLIGLVAALAAVLILLMAGTNMQAGELSPAKLFSFIFYAALLTRPVSALAHVYGEVQTARGTLARLQSVLDQPIETSVPAGSARKRALGRLEFADVHFAFPGRAPLLKGVSFAVEPGEVVALVGANGAGKSALISLLMRYYDPQSGTIRLDGHDISAMGVTDVRRQIGLVPQHTLLFNGSIRDNIAYGSAEPATRAITRAVRLAQAESFIASLPAGLDTVIGDRGVRLSGGQRQRVALARALLKDPPILVFDEATSMFDEDSESAFIAGGDEALAGRTVILVAHRPATLELATRKLVLEDGRIRDGAKTPGEAAGVSA